MARSDEIRSLGEDIITSYETLVKEGDARVKGIKELIKDTHQTLSNFRKEHEQMADTLKKNLAKSVKERTKEIKKLLEGFRAVFGGFRLENEKTSAEWQNLAATMAKKRGFELRGIKVSPKQKKKASKKEGEEAQ